MTETEHIKKTLSELDFEAKKIKHILDNHFSIGEKLKVLYLEDDEADADFVKEVLDIKFIDIDVAVNYESAVFKFENKKYNAFIVDLILNDHYSGFDFINFIQKQTNAPIIVLTGVEDSTMKKECESRGLQYIYQKSDLIHLIKYSSVFINSLLGNQNEYIKE